MGIILELRQFRRVALNRFLGAGNLLLQPKSALHATLDKGLTFPYSALPRTVIIIAAFFFRNLGTYRRHAIAECFVAGTMAFMDTQSLNIPTSGDPSDRNASGAAPDVCRDASETVPGRQVFLGG